jgi:hypothetical protein
MTGQAVLATSSQEKSGSPEKGETFPKIEPGKPSNRILALTLILGSLNAHQHSQKLIKNAATPVRNAAFFLSEQHCELDGTYF